MSMLSSQVDELRKLAGDGSMEWTAGPIRASVLHDAADTISRLRDTCTVESSHGYTDAFVQTRYVHELSCHTIDGWPDPEPPSYCPYCGKKVTE